MSEKKEKLFVYMEPTNNDKKQCSECLDLLSRRGFVARIYINGTKLSRTEYLCSKDARKKYPNYFK